MSSPVNAIETAESDPAVSAGALAVKLWPCAADASEVVPKMKKMKAMTNHLLHNPIWIFTAYNLPFLLTFFPPRVSRLNRASRWKCHQFVRKFNNSLDRANHLFRLV